MTNPTGVGYKTGVLTGDQQEAEQDVKVIMRQTVEKLGEEGTVVVVKDGFARNYLIPKGLAVRATTKRVKNIEHERKLIEDRRRRELKEAGSLAQKIQQASCRVYVQVGEEDKLFGTVTTADIAEVLVEQGIDIDRKKISLEEPIRALGIYTARVRVAPEVTAELKVWVEKRR